MSAKRESLENIGLRLLRHSARVVEQAEQVRACGHLVAKSVMDMTRTAEPDEVRERAEAVRAGVVRAVMLLLELNADSGAMIGLAHAAEAIEDDEIFYSKKGSGQ